MSAIRHSAALEIAIAALAMVIPSSGASAQQRDMDEMRRRIGRMLDPGAPLGAALVEQARDVAREKGLPPWRPGADAKKESLPFASPADAARAMPGWHALGGVADPIRAVPAVRDAAAPARVPVPSAKPSAPATVEGGRTVRRAEAGRSKAAPRREKRRGRPSAERRVRPAVAAEAAKSRPNILERLFGPPVVREPVGRSGDRAWTPTRR